MKVSVLDATAFRKALPRLIAKHDQIYMAVAWAHTGLVADKLIENKHKFRSVTVGLDFCATDPDFVDLLREVPNAYVFKRGGVLSSENLSVCDRPRRGSHRRQCQFYFRGTRQKCRGLLASDLRHR